MKLRRYHVTHYERINQDSSKVLETPSEKPSALVNIYTYIFINCKQITLLKR